MKNLYINTRFYMALLAVGSLYVLAFFLPLLLWFAHALLIACILALASDIFLLFAKENAVVGISDSDMWRHKQGGSSCLANRNLELN
jgi:hypothetical protein